MSVHRKDCINVEELFKEANRIIEVSWIEQKQASYNVDIEVDANDRSGLLADIIKEISNTKANLIAVNAKASKERIAVVDITIETKNLDELNQILKALRKVDSVYEVKRKKG